MSHGRNRAHSVLAAAALGPAIDAAAEVIEAQRRIPEPLLSALHESRLLRMLLPVSCGGDQVDAVTYFRAVEQVSRHDASLGWLVFVANSTVLIAPFLEPEIAREIFSDARAVIAWGPPNGCRAKAVDGGYRVTGKWDFASGCRQATWMGVHVQVEKADGTLQLNRRGRPAVRTLLFPAERAVLLDTWSTIGLCGTASDSYALDNLFVPEAYASTREEPESRREPGSLYAIPMQGLYAIGVAGVAIGTARAMLGDFIELAQRKAPRGLGRLADAAAVQGEVGRAEAKLGAAVAYIAETLVDVQSRADAWAIVDVNDRGRVRLASAFAIQAASDVTDSVYKAAGVDAIFKGSRFERRFRDMHTLSQQIQARGSHFEAVGQILLGRPPEPFF